MKYIYIYTHIFLGIFTTCVLKVSPALCLLDFKSKMSEVEVGREIKDSSLI